MKKKKKAYTYKLEFYQIHCRVYWEVTVNDNKEKKYIKKFKRELIHKTLRGLHFFNLLHTFIKISPRACPSVYNLRKKVEIS